MRDKAMILNRHHVEHICRKCITSDRGRVQRWIHIPWCYHTLAENDRDSTGHEADVAFCILLLHDLYCSATLLHNVPLLVTLSHPATLPSSKLFYTTIGAAHIATCGTVICMYRYRCLSTSTAIPYPDESTAAPRLFVSQESDID